MREVSAFPRPIREIMTQWIPMPDGCRLAARIWLPVDAEDDPVPAVLEYLPYRRRDGTANRDAVTQPYIAGHGYAAVRVDVRGTGDSDGILVDEYDLPEIADGVSIIAWLAEQPWCNGRVGMWGISWGGFNALQVAAQNPPALKAIIPMGFTHDRYNGDCHFMGGCLLEGNMSWGNTFLAGTSRPPDPAVVGDGWRDQWLARLDAIEQPIGIWLSHQRRDDYWKPGSVCEDFSRITAAVYAVSGWQDSYSRNVFPLVEGLTAPWKVLIGPWAHSWPHIAVPGPRIGFLQEALRWWDYWLRDIDTGIMDEPRVRVWMGAWTEPRKYVPEWPGRWVQLATWPIAHPRRLHLTEAGLSETQLGSGEVVFQSMQAVGFTASYQNSYGLGPDLADDQRADDALSCCFDTAPLGEALEILGEPFLDLDVSCNTPQALIAARLCDVSPDGASLRLSYGLLNLSHRNGSADPEPLVPGQRVRIRIPLCALAHRVAPGHRIRVALSTSYWPIAWPSPAPAAITLALAGSAIVLPCHAPEDSVAGPDFGEPEGAAPAAIVPLRPRQTEIAQDSISIDAVSGNTLLSRDRDRGAWHAVDTDVAYDATGTLVFAINADDPLSARQEFQLTTTLGRDGWRTRTKAWSRLTATADSFLLESRVEAFEDDINVFERNWRMSFARDNM
jgi:putative CocE/NonD family hydrolase